ncbi:glycoside hydrolase family 15 protein [Exidia glandulosa HHB12029]|uniref:Glycoside hydrolase family 15 protein n=1 Tax=Exidia glandulosa HHB12029 TaxID=1314781 RepID=A0A165JAG1_EXIGL|nr:glycoside hydrolase family 15 protein [Exidia glandulosa HHB12029]
MPKLSDINPRSLARSALDAIKPHHDGDAMAPEMNPDHEQGRGYMNIHDHALIGNLRTAALISMDGSVESYCVPYFDSPSVFARILDKDKGGHFSINPCADVKHTVKQAYMPSSNVLTTKFLSEEGVAVVTDFLPRQSDPQLSNKPLLFWLIRRVEVIRGRMPIRMECAPAFDYARAKHDTDFVADTSVAATDQSKVIFKSDQLSLDLRYIADGADSIPGPQVKLKPLDLSKNGHLGLAACADIDMYDGQVVTFVLRIPPGHQTLDDRRPTKEQIEQLGIPIEVVIKGAQKLRSKEDPLLTDELIRNLLSDTNKYWKNWISRSTYKGRWREAVHRSALALKLLIFEPTGAVIASPTFSLPEYIGGTRNWDYRYSWIRDSSFTLYALIRLGFTAEANAFMEFIFCRIKNRNPDGSLQIMYTIHGGSELEEIELNHLDGHKGSKPVRVGNGAADHVQLDIYGELMDCIYLGQKFGRPLSYEIWTAVRELVDYVIKHIDDQDLSIWEVRSMKRHFTYSKVMMWVAIDRGLRLADKRSLPCPRRMEWLAARDKLYEDIMTNAWNAKEGFFAQSYEDKDVVDSAVVIMPLVFFAAPTDNRFISTLDRILSSRERGGLTANGLVFRYDTVKADDGVGGEEGTFCLCTLWCIEALTRVGEYDPPRLAKAVRMFEDFLQYSNHVGLCTEEIGPAGEGLGNAVQGFTHVTLISAAYNLSRTLDQGSR